MDKWTRAALVGLMVLVGAISSPAATQPQEDFQVISATATNTAVTFTDSDGNTFKPTSIFIRNTSGSANTVYLSIDSTTVGTITGRMRLDPGEWTIVPAAWSSAEPGIAGIGLKCDTAETATVHVWGVR